MGFFDDIFGGFFDFNGDGKTTWDEEWIAYKIFEDINKDDNDSDSAFHSHGLFRHQSALNDTNFDNSDALFDDDIIDEETEDYSWRIWCEDGSDYDIFPEEYETEEEYNEALVEAKTAWKENYQVNINEISPNDYDTEDEYLDALQEETSEHTSDDISIPLKLTFAVECPALDELEAIKESDYLNKMSCPQN